MPRYCDAHKPHAGKWNHLEVNLHDADPQSTNSTLTTSTTEVTVVDNRSTKSKGHELRLLFVVDGWFPALGGAELQALKLAKALSAKGVSIDFLAPHLDRRLPINSVVEGFNLTKLNYPPVRLLGAVCLNIRFAWYLLRHRREYDSVHIHITQNLAATAGYIKPWLKIPVITKVSGYYEFEKGVLSEQSGRNILLQIARLGLRKVDFVQTISRQTEEKLLNSGFSKWQIKTIPNGIKLNKTPRSRIWYSGQQLVIGYCGRLQAIKGVDILIQGFARFLELKPGFNALLKIAGTGVIEKELRELVEQLGIEDKVSFLGLVNNVERLLEQCDLYVQASYAEGLPNSVMEAMNTGLPIVASQVGGNQDLVADGQNGYLFPAGNVDALAECLLRSIEDEEELKIMGERSRMIIAEKYGFEAVTPELLKLYGHGR